MNFFRQEKEVGLIVLTIVLIIIDKVIEKRKQDKLC